MLGYKRTHPNHHFNLVLHILKFSDSLSQLLIQSPTGEATVFNLYYICFHILILLDTISARLMNPLIRKAVSSSQPNYEEDWDRKRWVRASGGFMLPWKPPWGPQVLIRWTVRHPLSVASRGCSLPGGSLSVPSPGLVSLSFLPLHRWRGSMTKSHLFFKALLKCSPLWSLLEGGAAWVEKYWLLSQWGWVPFFATCSLCDL